MVDISNENPAQTEARLLKVIRTARLTVYTQTYAFLEFPLPEFPRKARMDALALVRDDRVWSQLVPCNDDQESLFTLFRFHFPPNADNSGFVGWLATHLKRKFGTGVFVTCGQNRADGGIFDYWGVPIAIGAEVISEVGRLVGTPQESREVSMNLDGLSFQVCVTASVGVVSAETRLRLVQRGSRVFGRYEGGSILNGCLVGQVSGNMLTFRYAQRERDSSIHGGRSDCVLEVLRDGRLRMHEHFTWSTREGTGTNIFEQVSS
jgi:Family of unknown function (DUF6196)